MGALEQASASHHTSGVYEREQDKGAADERAEVCRVSEAKDPIEKPLMTQCRDKAAGADR